LFQPWSTHFCKRDPSPQKLPKSLVIPDVSFTPHFHCSKFLRDSASTGLSITYSNHLKPHPLSEFVTLTALLCFMLLIVWWMLCCRDIIFPTITSVGFLNQNLQGFAYKISSAPLLDAWFQTLPHPMLSTLFPWPESWVPCHQPGTWLQ